jgi:hypothetical protein
MKLFSYEWRKNPPDHVVKIKVIEFFTSTESLLIKDEDNDNISIKPDTTIFCKLQFW